MHVIYQGAPHSGVIINKRDKAAETNIQHTCTVQCIQIDINVELNKQRRYILVIPLAQHNPYCTYSWP
jgi:hypothetical protein